MTRSGIPAGPGLFAELVGQACQRFCLALLVEKKKREAGCPGPGGKETWVNMVDLSDVSPASCTDLGCVYGESDCRRTLRELLRNSNTVGREDVDNAASVPR